MNQAELIFDKALDMRDGEKLEIICPTETLQKRLFSMLCSERKSRIKEFEEPEADKIIITKDKTEEGKFRIIILKDENLFSSAVIIKKNGTEENISHEDLKPGDDIFSVLDRLLK